MQKLIVIFLALSIAVFSQAQDHFLVELENRAPDVMSMVQAYEGFPSVPFLANDIDGKEYSLQDIQAEGKNTILWFWNLECPKCFEQIEVLNKIQAEFNENLQIISFADNDKLSCKAFTELREINFPIIPSSKTLSDGPYGGELGHPKIFMIDEYGIIKWVFPEVVMKTNFDTYNILKTLMTQLSK